MKLFLLIISVIVLTKAESDIGKFMKHLGVIPDVINDSPDDYLTVQYANGIKADKGVELKPTQVKNQPLVKWRAEEGTFYTLAMVDPDAPSRDKPKMREWHHWLVVNIPDNRVARGDILSEYIGAGPPKDTGLHRYVFLVYKQPKGTIKFTEKKLNNRSGENRGNFSIKKFAEKYSLGKPIAGNFFQAQWDDYVPKLYAQLGL